MKSVNRVGSGFFFCDEPWPAAAGALLGVALAWAGARLFAGVVALPCLAAEVRRGVPGLGESVSSCFAGDMVLARQKRDPS